MSRRVRRERRAQRTTGGQESSVFGLHVRAVLEKLWKAPHPTHPIRVAADFAVQTVSFRGLVYKESCLYHFFLLKLSVYLCAFIWEKVPISLEPFKYFQFAFKKSVWKCAQHHIISFPCVYIFKVKSGRKSFMLPALSVETLFEDKIIPCDIIHHQTW